MQPLILNAQLPTRTLEVPTIRHHPKIEWVRSFAGAGEPALPCVKRSRSEHHTATAKRKVSDAIREHNGEGSKQIADGGAKESSADKYAQVR